MKCAQKCGNLDFCFRLTRARRWCRTRSNRFRLMWHPIGRRRPGTPTCCISAARSAASPATRRTDRCCLTPHRHPNNSLTSCVEVCPGAFPVLLGSAPACACPPRPPHVGALVGGAAFQRCRGDRCAASDTWNQQRKSPDQAGLRSRSRHRGGNCSRLLAYAVNDYSLWAFPTLF